MKTALLILCAWPLCALADPTHLTVEGGLAAGTTSELRPLAFSEALGVYLVERSDKRPTGSERSWNFYGRRALDLLGYATLTTDAGVSDEHVQWMSDGNVPAGKALANLATQARETLRTDPKAIDQLWADWQKLRVVPCPVRAVKRDGAVDVMAHELTVVTVDTPLAPADARRGCRAPAPGTLRCSAGPDGDVLVAVGFRQDCAGPVAQQQLILYNARNVEYLKEAQAGEAALKKGDTAGARRHLEASLKLDPKHAPSHFFHACVAARSGVAFREGRAELEGILGSEDERQLWLPKIKSDPSLQSWRADPEFARWFAQFPTRTPIRQ